MLDKKEWLLGSQCKPDEKDFAGPIAFNDHKIKFVVERCRGKNVLDLGCVQHNPRNYGSKYWLHKAIASVAESIVGVDLYEAGVEYLNKGKFNVIVADVQCFNLNRTFDVIVAGDVIEHLENFDGFLESCKRHMKNHSILLISTPNPWYWKNIVKAALTTEVSNNPEHTCWFCPRTLRQLCNRHGLKLGEIVFGSRYLRDRLMPFPKGLRHTSFHMEIFKII